MDTELFADDTVADPYPYLARLRATEPVHPIGGDSGVYLVTSMALVKQVVADTETFSNHYVGFVQRDDDGTPFVLPMVDGDTIDRTAGVHVLATADPPDHGRHRRVLQPHLSASAVEAMAPTMRSFTDELIGAAVQQGRVEWMTSCAQLLPMRVIARLLGVPDSAVPRMLEFGYASGERIGGLASRERLAQLDEIAFREAGAFVAEAYERERNGSGDTSLVRALFDAVDRGELDEMEALTLLTLVVIAGGESTASLIGNATFLLARDAELQRRLRADQEAIPAFIEEALRLESPFRAHPRLVTTDTELGGVHLPRGSHVMLMWPAANRDPAAFDDPDIVDIDRERARTHVAFGWGIHLCVGAPLARAEARIAMESLLAHTSSVTIDPDAATPEYVPSLQVRRLRNLPLLLAEA